MIYTKDPIILSLNTLFQIAPYFPESSELIHPILYTG